jgi:hypothetical protein
VASGYGDSGSGLVRISHQRTLRSYEKREGKKAKNGGKVAQNGCWNGFFCFFLDRSHCRTIAHPSSRIKKSQPRYYGASVPGRRRLRLKPALVKFYCAPEGHNSLL